MRYRSRKNFRIFLIVFAIFACNVGGRLVRHSYYKELKSNNQKRIDTALALLQYKQDQIDHDLSLLVPLLKLKKLTDAQYSQIHLLISNLYYQKGDMHSYFNNVGNALFYSQKSENKDNTIFIYANMAKYFLEIGADQEAFDIINKASTFGSFYECENPMTRILACLVNSAYLINQGEYDRAALAADQILKDASSTTFVSPEFPVYFERNGKVIKALILLAQEKYDEAYESACKLWDKYYSPDEVVSRFTAFDFHMPVLYIKTIWALSHKDYKKAVEFNELYGNYCDQFFFKLKKISLSRKLMAELPADMASARAKIFQEVSNDSRELSDSVVQDYTLLAKEKFTNIMNELFLQAEINGKSKEYIHSVLLNVFIVFVILLLFYAVITELQTDGLTKLSTRRALNTRIRYLDFMKRNYCAIMIDLDDFKKINDSYGHAFGDEVLKKVGGVLLDAERRSIRAYRYGGEEMVLLFERTTFDDVIRYAESIRTKIFRIKYSQDVKVSASLGIGAKPADPIQQADDNLYFAKRKGKNIAAYKVDDKQYLAERRLEIRNPMPDKLAQ